MSVLVIAILTTICLPFLLPFFIKKYRFRKLINKLPGPDDPLIFGSAMELLKCPADKRLELTDRYFRKYGDLFRRWIGYEAVVGIGNAEDAQVILSSTINIDKSMVYKFLEPWLGTGLLTSTGKKWAERRKMLTPAFHFSTLNSFFGTMVENCDIFLEKLEAKENCQEFDMYSFVNNCSLDIICETAMGVKVRAQDGDSEYASSLKELAEIVLKRFFSPWLWMDWIYFFTSQFKKEQTDLNTVHRFTLKVIDQKKREQQEETKSLLKESDDENKSEKKKPFLKLLLDILDKRGETFSNSDLREEVDTFMFEGHDTVSSATSWAIFLIGLYPDIQENIFQEIYSIFGDSDRSPTMDDIRQMKYLEMVIKESLRLYPAVPFISRELTEDVILGGYRVPAGAVADINIYQIHRNAKYYEKPNEFYPEHFTPESSSSRHPFAFIPFSAGPRNCIGQKFATLEEKLLLSSLIRKYKIEALQNFDNISRVAELVLRPGNGIKVRISRRHMRLELTDKYFKKYGDLFRRWLGNKAVVGIGNAEDAKVILSSAININKSMRYRFLEPWLGTGLLTSTGKKWAERRKVLTPAFHFSTLNSFFGTMVENCDIFLEKLEAKENCEEFDIYSYVNNCSLDIICETAMGVTVRAQEGGSEYASSIKKLAEIVIKRFVSPWLWTDWIYSFTSQFKKEQTVLNTVHGFTLKVIEQKKREQEETIRLHKESNEENKSEKKKPFLKLLLDILDKRGETFSNSDVREEVDTFMFEGHDTVSSATSWAIFLIGLYPDIQENIFQEIYSIFGDSDRSPTMDDIRQMKYLEMVIKEALRLYPAVPNISRELTEDVVLGGHRVPAGAVIEINIYRLHRNAKYYKKPDEFYPEHFTPENSSSRHPFAFIPFSAGPRNCIGQKFATLEEKLLLSSLIRKYKIETLQNFDNISRVVELVLHPGNGIKVIEQKKREQEETKSLHKESDEENKSEKKKPFLKLLLDILDKRGETFSNSDLREEVDTFMFTGHDTVSSATSWAIFLIGLYPDIQENIFQEIHSIFGDSDRSPTMDDICQMKYLEMVIKESLRLYPTVPFIGRELIEDVVLGGYRVPAGAVVQINIYQLHRNAKYYEKPNEFYPEHFTQENSSSRHPIAFIPFSAGPRNCIGQKFATLAEKLLLSSLIRKYKIQALQNFDNISRVAELVLRPGNGIKTILTCRKNITKAFTYKLLDRWLATGLLMSSGSKWATRRKLLTPAFHFSILNTFMGVIADNCSLLLDTLKVEENQNEFDIHPYISNCALDIICETTMGVKINAKSVNSEYLESINEMADITKRRLHQKNKAFLDLLLDISEENGDTFTDSDLREEVNTFLFTGHDTVTVATSWAIYLIGSHPAVQEKIFEELNTVFGSSERPPTRADIHQLTYLDMVIKESLRLYPPGFTTARTLSTDMTFRGYKVPAGTIMEIYIFQIHRDPKHYENPLKFDPEHFSAENSSKRHPFAFIPFSAGPRNCIGQKFAMLEEKILLSTLLRRYRIESLQKAEDLILLPALVLTPGNGIKGFTITLEGLSYCDHSSNEYVNLDNLKIWPNLTSSGYIDIQKDMPLAATVSLHQKNKAFLDLLLDISEENGDTFTDSDLREEVNTFLFTGHDTVTVATSWAIYLIGSHPAVQEKIFEELNTVFGSSERPPTRADIHQLTYLDMVIKESLRLYPPGFTTARTLSTDMTFRGYKVPAGTIMEIYIFQIHRDPKHYENPLKFDPEHFSAENSSKRHPFAFIPFSAGPRNCIGQKFAMLEEKILLSTLLRRYRIESLQKAEDLILLPALVLTPGNGIKGFTITLEGLSYCDHSSNEYVNLDNLKIWPNLTSSGYIDIQKDMPLAATIILTCRKNITKAITYKVLDKWLATGLVMSSGSKWATRRKLLTPAFHFSILNTFMGVITENCSLLLDKLKVEENQNEFDIHPYISNCALDIICETTMGVKINAKSANSEYLESMPQKNKAFLDLLLDISEENGDTFTDSDLREEVNTFLFAGHDTVTVAASWAIYLIGSHPDVQEKIFQELNTVFGSSERPPSRADIHQLTYLDMVIKETLRLYPPVFSTLRTLSTDMTFRGYKVPAGTTMEINIFQIHRDPKHYENPLKFDPEHFSAENSTKRHPFAFIPFSAGPRNCIGQKFAILEEKILLSTLLRRYRIESLQKAEDLILLPELVLTPGNGMKVRISRRLSSTK
ncbi:hypothetical protein V9T40_002333 [Parthenolecanium corni]|uniref:Cytochrome P450 n=1 Tax=Parthenolecanium corni TaxID=536013 RepID=A0AAN9TGI8_9HEMI